MKVTLKGFLARQPELVYTDKGTGIWKTALAVQGRSKEDETVFIEVIAFNGLAEALAELELAKGTLVQVEGRLQTETYQGKDGKKTRLSLVVDELAVVVRRKKKEEKEEAGEGEEPF